MKLTGNFLQGETESLLAADMNAEPRPEPGRRAAKIAIVELAVALVMVLAALWTPKPWQQILSLIGLGWVVVCTWRSFEGWAALGFRFTGYLRSLWIVVVALLFAAIAVVVAADLNTLHVPALPSLFIERYWAYVLWSFLQQFLLLNFFYSRLRRLLVRTHPAAIAAASIFGFTHLPNPVLAPATLIWGYVACLVFTRYRNLYTPAMAHAILGISIAVTVPGPLDHNMRVGLGYLTYRDHGREHGRHQRSQRDHAVSTNVWVTAEVPTRRC